MNRKLTRNALLLCAGILMVMSGCKKKDPEPVSSMVSTQTPTNIDFTSATLNGNLTTPGTGGVTDHGFVWAETENPDLNAANKKSLGAKTEAGTFSHQVTGLTAGKTYHVRAYATDALGTAFGANQTFNALSLAVTSFTPTEGTQGDTLIITGSNFTEATADITVKIGSVAATTIISASATEIKAVIPSGVTAGTSKISVTIKTTEGISADDFTYLGGLWTQKKSLSSFVDRKGQSFVLGAAGFVGTGSKELWQYDPSTDSWQQKATFGGDARFAAFAFVLGQKAYVGTGNKSGVAQSDVWEYNPLLNAWTQKNNFSKAISSSVGFTANSKGYVVNRSGELWQYDATNDSWTQKKSFPNTSIIRPIVMAINGTSYVGGGASNNTENLPGFWKYDATNDSWTSIKDFPGSVKEPAHFRPLVSFSFSSKGYVIEAGGQYRIWEYDPSADTWTKKAHNPNLNNTLPYYAQAFVVNDKAYIREAGVTGANKTLWEFDPSK